MLGETFELVTDKYRMLCELAVHHPPAIAYYVEGKSGYRRYSTLRPKPKLVKGSIQAVNLNKDYFEFLPHNERFAMRTPGLSIHNIIIGTPYLDLAGKLYLRNMDMPNEKYSVVEFFKRGWSANSYFRVTADVYSSANEIAYRLEGKWSE